MKRKALLIAILLLVAAVAVAGVLRSGWWKRDDPNRIHLSGNIELTQVDISFKVAGKLIERTVDEGDPVKKGQLIARIDRDTMERQKDRDAAGVFSAETELRQSDTSVAYQRETLEADIALRKAELREAQAHLNELETGSRPQEIAQARDAVSDAQAQFDQAQLDWQRAQELIKTDDISRAQSDQFRARFDSTRAMLSKAKETSGLVVEGPRKEQIEAARAQVARAAAAIRMSEANRLELKRREEETTTRRAEIQRNQAQMAMTQSQLKDMFVISPIDGVVLVKSAELGEVLAAGTTVVSIGDIDHPWLRGYINERDLGRVHLGDKANITSDSFPGKIYPGHVSFIASEAEFTPKQIQTSEERVKLVYRIKIEAENPHRELKSNMPVEADILIAQP
jgi:HlyD family secretion protein